MPAAVGKGLICLGMCYHPSKCHGLKHRMLAGTEMELSIKYRERIFTVAYILQSQGLRMQKKKKNSDSKWIKFNSNMTT